MGYYFVQATTVMILVLANTGFTFPMLAASMAKDKYMPRMFSVRGDRLGLFELYHHFRCWGYLAYYHFDGKTENLIPLYVRCIYSIHISTIWHGT